MNLLFFILSLSATCFANDTIYGLSGGNITYEKTDKVSMESEDLYLSPAYVSVKYVFRNNSKEALKAKVAFPIGEVMMGGNYTFSPEDFLKGKDPLSFELKVNGKKKPFKMEVEKISEDNEVVGLKVRYVWEQDFPPGTDVLIEHKYRSELRSGTPDEERYRAIYCMDESFEKAHKKGKLKIKERLEKQSRAGVVTKSFDSELHYDSYGYLDYILMTAKNWAGPIKKFHLTIDKVSPDALVSLCWDGLEKTSPTRFESTKINFVPERDLKLLFFQDRLCPDRKCVAQ